MNKVVIYTKDACPYCVAAKNLLKQKSVAFEEINLQEKPQELLELKQRTGLRTVPQIFIAEKLIGGFTDLQKLDREGKLDAMLAGS